MQSLDRAIQVLDVLSKCPEGMPITELSDRIGLSLSTTHRFLQSLGDNDLVIQDPVSRRYKLGLKLLSLASGLLKSDRLLQMSHEPMQKAVADAEAQLQGRGRVLIRPSGTEPLLRVMVEADDKTLAQTLAQSIADTL